ncbi:carbohydrate ABC transporter permease [Gracilibacillus alcaliphilus]|uniref:carbohydrate ABC transporter permease n=1 Tax=Gracilibacillus alcaliphilus TaxID=1401441 RepID=UPI0019560897|nr:carbohydrate ABC transporter permease [Gracilibacillus alcaliphilus]MBM7679012.1 putative aldouronate transport system permease protein [Gracilibacillus alcaliphilus]
MFSKLSKGDVTFTVINYALLCLVVCLMIYPLVYVVSSSISNPEKMLLGELWLFPKDLTLDSYVLAFKNSDIWMGYRNTIFYTVLGTLINLTLSIMIAYPLSRSDFYGRGVITAFIIFTMFFSGGMIPTYLLVRDLGMVDTIWAVTIPGAVSVYNVIIMRTFFQGIPEEIREAAAIDGSTNLHFLWKIVLPLSTPIIAVMALFYGVGHWNSYFDALIYLQDSGKFPLQLFLRQMLIQDDMTAMSTSGTDGVAQHILRVEGLKYAVVLIASLPMLIVYPFLQKYFIKGVMIGSLKG